MVEHPFSARETFRRERDLVEGLCPGWDRGLGIRVSRVFTRKREKNVMVP
jgi:hypothetical protein